MKTKILALTLIAGLAAGEAMAQSAAPPEGTSGGSRIGSASAPQSVSNGTGSSGPGSTTNVGAPVRTSPPVNRAKEKKKPEPEKAIPRPVRRELNKR